MKTIPASLKRFAKMIDSVDDERGIQNGWWVNLKRGYICSCDGTHAIHEDTLSYCAAKLGFVEPCKCADCAEGRS